VQETRRASIRHFLPQSDRYDSDSGPATEVQTMPDSSTVPLAAIDIGSSAIRMDIAEIRPDGRLHILESLKRGVQLGKEAFTDGHLAEETIRAACEVLKAYKKVMDTYGVVRHRAVATSAVRESENRDMFLDRILMSTGFDVAILDASEENRLTYMAILDSLREGTELGQGKTLLVEVGGGSTEVTLMAGQELLQSGTFALGTIRLCAGISSRSGTHDQQVRALKRQINSLLGNVRRNISMKEALNCIAVGGEVRFAARALKLGATGRPAVVPRESFAEFVDSVMKQTIDGLVLKYSIPYLDAETLAPALWTYLQLLKETQAPSLVISDASIRAGILQDMSPTEEGKRLETMRQQILSAARGLGKKYQYDETHAERVLALSELIFDEMRGEQHMTEVHRLYLQVAALLHDIGLFVSSRGHHKHSFYLISASDVFGLRHREVELIANIARYHRRALPQRGHPEFMSLEREERMTVSKLSAIIRVANALAKGPYASTRDLKVSRDGDQFIITAENASDLALEKVVLASRGDLFAQVFGKRVVLRETSRFA
jgi:exopolyphosphatase / guanosine-5'-triphosphate,3'-diphosphate pyrophosphatase